jgi:rSAM/selenodomain-associated transferase 1
VIHVLLFAKAPRPGVVKTRLAASIGDEAAVRLYRVIGRRIIDQIRPVSNVTVYYDPPDALLEAREWLGDAEYRRQSDGSLGDRLTAALHEHFAGSPSAPVVAIGADAPEVDAGVITAAADALGSADVVLGPAMDGGYYLIGLKQERPNLFTAIPWSGSTVLAATRAACDAARLTTVVLSTLRDIDTVEDAIALGAWPLT